MKYLCNDSDRVFMAMLKDELEASHIQVYVKNQYSANSMVPWNITCYSAELYVVDEDDLELAEQKMHKLARDRDDLDASFAWGCPKCGEMLEPQFNECWKCGYLREEA